MEHKLNCGVFSFPSSSPNRALTSVIGIFITLLVGGLVVVIVKLILSKLSSFFVIDILQVIPFFNFLFIISLYVFIHKASISG